MNKPACAIAKHQDAIHAQQVQRATNTLAISSAKPVLTNLFLQRKAAAANLSSGNGSGIDFQKQGAETAAAIR